MRTRKMLSLLLVLIMIISILSLSAYAEDTKLATLSVSEQYDALMAMYEKDEAAAEAVYNALTAEQKSALQEYAKTRIEAEREEYSISAVNYTKVAPIVQENGIMSQSSRRASLRAAAIEYTPVDAVPIKGDAAEGLLMNKTATPNGSGGYDIKLEAYTTGSVTTVDTTKPTDIILVLDQSGSMAYDMTTHIYSPAYPGSNHEGTYYVKSNNGYVPLTWCSRCEAWTDGCYWFFGHIRGEKYTPKTSVTDTISDHVQFYLRTGMTTARRLDALISALTNFTGTIKEKCAGVDNQPGTVDDIDHRVAIVGFSSNDFNNTELLTGCNITTANKIIDGNTSYYPTGWAHNGIQYSSGITVAQYANALQSIKDEAGQNGVANAIASLTAHGGTNTLDGLTMAENILKNSDGTGRNRVVILFTDGDTDSARNAVVNKAYSLKNTYHATVYTVGIFEGANGEPPITSSTNAANVLLHRVSSNYPNANGYASGTINPNLKDGESYYLSAADADALNNIFQKISQQMGSSSINLSSATIVKDIVSPYFDMPVDTDAITVKSYDCIGFTGETPSWSANGISLSDSVSLDLADNSVSVTGFDFNRNFVAETGRLEGNPAEPGSFYGRKLEISFTVTAKEGFLGGNNVPTNGTLSGVYDADGTRIATFDVPTVNVPMTVPVLRAEDKNIYLMNMAPEAADMASVAVPAGSDAWKADFVVFGDITADKEISNIEDTEVELSIMVTPRYNGAGSSGEVQQSVIGKATAKVNVFTPEVNFSDSTIYLGDTADYGSNEPSSVTWKHGETMDSDVPMTGAKPAMIYSYDTNEGAFTDCTDVGVTVKIGNTDITEKTAGDKHFMVHVLQPSISVTVKDVVKYYGESYVPGEGANGSISLMWMDKNNHSGIPAAIGMEPYKADDLSLSYDTDGFSGTIPDRDFDVTVRVMKGNAQMEAAITTNCEYGCELTQNDGKYTVHVKTCTLTVKKSGCDTVKDANQSFIFDVIGPKTMKVVVYENGCVQIVGLPIGSYSVIEDGNWSWRYLANNRGNVVLSAINPNAEVSIDNERKNPYWLGGDSCAINTATRTCIH